MLARAVAISSRRWPRAPSRHGRIDLWSYGRIPVVSTGTVLRWPLSFPTTRRSAGSGAWRRATSVYGPRVRPRLRDRRRRRGKSGEPSLDLQDVRRGCGAGRARSRALRAAAAAALAFVGWIPCSRCTSRAAGTTTPGWRRSSWPRWLSRPPGGAPGRCAVGRGGPREVGAAVPASLRALEARARRRPGLVASRLGALVLGRRDLALRLGLARGIGPLAETPGAGRATRCRAGSSSSGSPSSRVGLPSALFGVAYVGSARGVRGRGASGSPRGCCYSRRPTSRPGTRLDVPLAAAEDDHAAQLLALGSVPICFRRRSRCESVERGEDQHAVGRARTSAPVARSAVDRADGRGATGRGRRVACGSTTTRVASRSIGKRGCAAARRGEPRASSTRSRRRRPDDLERASGARSCSLTSCDRLASPSPPGIQRQTATARACSAARTAVATPAARRARRPSSARAAQRRAPLRR